MPAPKSAPSRYSPGRAKFEDSLTQGPGSELLPVEGDSALALQGKSLNAWVAALARVAQHAHDQLLAEALGPRLAGHPASRPIVAWAASHRPCCANAVSTRPPAEGMR